MIIKNYNNITYFICQKKIKKKQMTGKCRTKLKSI